jgi:hypothetical protein
MDLSNRHFQVWQYTVSLARLYLRSTKTEKDPKNIDVVFLGVQYIDLITEFDGLQIVAPTPEEEERARTLSNRREFQPDWVRALMTGPRRSLVIAAGMSIRANELEHDESGLEHDTTST